uniref:Retrotransposon protein, putative, Ty1-copia subclass n=1 Tax=Tanacetum cinerariifolium TaxID=118510 RepID=A0A6L2MDQ9_TANCI|nr:hypothetical protein [Tanacetum cinerariifolium]
MLSESLKIRREQGSVTKRILLLLSLIPSSLESGRIVSREGFFAIMLLLVKVRFVAQLDEGRHLQKRPTEFHVDKVLQPFDGRIAPTTIIDRQLPFEYTITSRSTDVVVERQMAHPVQNINHSAFRSMFEREKFSGNNFNDWFRQLKLVLRVEKKMYVIEQPLPTAPAADSTPNVLAEWNAIYDAHNEMKGYVDQLERLGYMLPHDLVVGLILNGLIKDFVGFVRNYNMHNMGKMIDKLHAMLIEYEKGLPKKAETPRVMMIKGGKIQKDKKKPLKAKGKDKANGKGNDKQVYIPKPKNPKPFAKEHPTKDDTCHHYKEVGYWKRNWSCLSCRVVEEKQASWLCQFFSKGIYEIDMHDLVPNVNSIYNVSTKRAKYNLDSTYLWHRRLAHISKKRIEKLQQKGLLKSTYDESFDQCVSCLSGKMTRKSFPHRPRRATDLLGIIHTDVCGLLRHVSRQESATRILNMVPTKKVDKTPHELKVNGRTVDLKEIQDEDTSPSEITSEIPMEVEGFEPPQEEVIPIRRFERTHRAPDRLCLNVEVEEHSLGDLNEPASYKLQYTFSPVDDIRAIRILISIAVYYDYEIWQMDVKTDFLNGYLDEDIYMVQPEGFVDPDHPRKTSGSNVTFLILYVDDIIIMGNHIQSLQSVKDYLGKCFTMKDLKEATFILGIKIYRDGSKRLIELGQNAYMDKILKRYKMDNSKRGHIPMQERLDLNKTQGASTPKEVKRIQNVPYTSVVGSIMYAVRCIRPDVVFAQNITSRFQHNPSECHWTAMKNILKDDTKSQTGHVFILNGGAVDWKSSKQSATAMSATEAEYIAASKAAIEAVWIRKFISGLGEIRFLKVDTDENLADPFTKALPKGKLTQHARSMGLRLASRFMSICV